MPFHLHCLLSFSLKNTLTQGFTYFAATQHHIIEKGVIDLIKLTVPLGSPVIIVNGTKGQVPGLANSTLGACGFSSRPCALLDPGDCRQGHFSGQSRCEKVSPGNY